MKHKFNVFVMVIALLTLASFISLGSAAPVKSGLNIGPSVALVELNASRGSPRLDVAVDLCAESKHGNCLLNQHLIGNACYGIRGFSLSSIYFAGSTSCILYYLDNCDENSIAIKVMHSEDDLGVLNWNDWTTSIRCYRPDKLAARNDIAIYPVEPDHSPAARDTAAPALGVALDFCEDSDHQNCLLNQHLNGNECYQVTMKGLSSIYFEGHMACVLFSAPYCDTGNGDRSLGLNHKVDNLKDFNFNDMTQSISCFRWD